MVKNRVAVGESLSRKGTLAEAEQVDDELRKMLVYADANHPILLELQKRRQS